MALRGGGAKADPNELMTAALCTLSSIPEVTTVDELDALIEKNDDIVLVQISEALGAESERLAKLLF